MTTPLQIRPATIADHAFVFSSWLRSYRIASEFTRHIPAPDYYAGHHAWIEQYLARPHTLLIAHTAEEPTIILGWLAATDTGTVVHYVYVKEALRQLGVARALWNSLARAPTALTHLTGRGLEILRTKSMQIDYNPYLFFGVNK